MTDPAPTQRSPRRGTDYTKRRGSPALAPPPKITLPRQADTERRAEGKLSCAFIVAMQDVATSAPLTTKCS